MPHVKLCIAVLLVAALAPASNAQQSKPKKTPFDEVIGYKVHTLAGFTVIVSDDVLQADVSSYKRKPLDCLELELKNIVGLVNDRTANALRRVPIWAEWDNRFAPSTGRAGLVYAVYYGGPQASLLTRDIHPLKSKCVVLMLTKRLTESYQEKERPETLVLLHELAHAVHDQLLGMQNADIKAAYQQAMARKLYDKSLYIATNEAEFFAEASCAFLDRIDYFPKNRAALKDHDPETYKLMNSVWGKAALTTEANLSKRPADGSEDFGLDIHRDKVKWSKVQVGKGFDPAQAGDRVVLIAYVANSQGAVLKRLRDWHDEYGSLGLAIVAVNAEYGRDPFESGSAFFRQKLPFAIHEPLFLPVKGNEKDRSERAGGAALFDASGRCVFRGQTDDATVYLKEAIGRRFVDVMKLPDENVPPVLAGIAKSLNAGESPVAAAVRAQALARSSDPAIAEPAKRLVDAVTEPCLKAVAEAQELKKTDPLEAYVILEKHAARFKGTTAGMKASNAMDSLRGERPVQAELRARRELEAVMKIEGQLAGKPGSFDPKSNSFRAANTALLNQLKQAVEGMKKRHPNTKATERAIVIAGEYGVS